MRLKIVRAIVLCLGATAALGIGAAPALAARGCTCHGVPPTGGAPAAHAPLVVGVTHCTTCHVGWTVPHPEAVKPTSYIDVWVGLGIFARGGLSRPFMPLKNVVVYVQKKRPAKTGYTRVGVVKTDACGLYGAQLGTVGPWMARAISQGLPGPPVVMPALSKPPHALPTPTLTFRLSGLTRRAVRLGHAVSLAGKVTPTRMAGRKVRLTVQKRDSAKSRWSTTILNPTISATGAYSRMYTPRHRGLYRCCAWIPETSAYHAASTDWRRFRVN
ncbi:MAG: hypothetical protein NTX16_10935 [Actinobacteria bacterium]|nr:hypothetical protein [Actinomycetota bacterium]